MDRGNTKTPSMHRRLGRATLSWLAFPGESDLNFPWEKSHWDNTVFKKKKNFPFWPHSLVTLKVSRSKSVTIRSILTEITIIWRAEDSHLNKNRNISMFLWSLFWPSPLPFPHRAKGIRHSCFLCSRFLSHRQYGLVALVIITLHVTLVWNLTTIG